MKHYFTLRSILLWNWWKCRQVLKRNHARISTGTGTSTGSVGGNEASDPAVYLTQVIHKHFYLKRAEIMAQCEEWIADIQQYSSDKRVGRTMSHHAAALKVYPPYALWSMLSVLGSPISIISVGRSPTLLPRVSLGCLHAKSSLSVSDVPLK